MKKLKITLFLILLIILIIIVAFAFRKPELKIKTFKNDLLSFDYVSSYKIVSKDNIIELSNSNSNIYVENRTMDFTEMNFSLGSVVDNIIYEYLKENKNYKLISKYDDYKFNDKTGYRLIFEDSVNRNKALFLITFKNLNLIMINLNASSDEFELLIDSAELIMNTLKVKSDIEYVSLETVYPEETFDKDEELITGTKEIPFDSTKLESYSFKLGETNDNEFKIKMPSNYKLNDDSVDHVLFESDDVRVLYGIDVSTDVPSYDEEKKVYISSEYDDLSDDYVEFITTPYGIGVLGDYQYHGYKKYGEKIYYVALKKDEDKTMTYSIVEPISYKYFVITIIEITTDYKLSEDIISNFLNYETEYNPKHSRLEDGYILGTMSKKSDNKTINIEYRVPDKYDVESDGYDIRTIVDNTRKIDATIMITDREDVESSISDEFKKLLESMFNAKINYTCTREKNVIKGENEFERYILKFTLNYVYTQYFILEKYVLDLGDSDALAITINYPNLSDGYAEFNQNFVDDVLNLKVNIIENED